MSAPGITYSGALAKKAANGSNNDKQGVFQGLKLWVSQRVPQRKACIDTIQENGGSITPRERDADLLICDPEKAPLSGSYTYQLIEDAVRDCSLDAKDDYLCVSSVIRPGAPVGTSSKPKLTRNRFTWAEEQTLMDYVREKEAQGEPINGNQIYKEFADTHPNHTWQSWRDRWIKRLQHLEQPPVSKEKQPAVRKQSSAAPRRGAAPESSSSAPAPKTKQRWTVEEDERILNAIHQAIKTHEPWDGALPYQRLAREFPQRTIQAWRERAVNHVAKQNRDTINRWQAEAESQSSFMGTNNEHEHLSASEDDEFQDAEMQDATTAERKTPDNIVVRAESEESEVQIEHTTTRNGDGTAQGRSSPRDTAISSTKKTSTPGVLARDASSPKPVSIPAIAPGSPGVEMKEQFYRDYNTFLDTSGVTTRPMASAGGRAISLWDLWHSVMSKKADPAELDWQQIAEDLGFDWIAIESAPDELRQCYETHLASFAEYMMGFDESGDDSDDETGDEESREADMDVESERPLPSSPPIRMSLKRVLDAADAVSDPIPPKRRILSRDDEIPSTPERGNRASRFRSQEPETPATASRRQVQQRGEHKFRVSAQPNATPSGNGVMRVAQSVPVQRRGQRVEPETQDFAFKPDTQVHDYDGSSDEGDYSQREATPSQQLRLESLAGSHRKMIEQMSTPSRRIRVPFRQDSGDEEDDEDEIPQTTRSTKVAQVPNTIQKKAQPKRRTLPASFVPPAHHVRNDVYSSPGLRDRRDSHQQLQQHTSSAPIPETQPRHRPTPPPPPPPPLPSSPPRETPEDIIDRFVSLGYSREIVMRSLKATSWIIGNAGQVMEMLKQGEPLPQRTSGVWTQRDDDSLVLAVSPPTNDQKEDRRREKAMRRLLAKHGQEQIDLRKRYLLEEVPL